MFLLAVVTVAFLWSLLDPGLRLYLDGSTTALLRLLLVVSRRNGLGRDVCFHAMFLSVRINT